MGWRTAGLSLPLTHWVPGQVAVSACALSHSNSRVLPCTLLTLRVCAEVQLRVFESFFEPECGVSEGTAVEVDPSTGPDGSERVCLLSIDHQCP